MKLKDLIKELEVREDLLDKDIKIVAQNGLRLDPVVKKVLKNEYDLT